MIAQHGLRTKKSLGQHFLLDGNLTDKIVRLAGNLDNQTVIEIGPGPGGLTRSILAANPKALYVLEKDDRCIAIMQELKAYTDSPLHIMHGDALSQPCASMGDAPRSIIANLPYNVGTELLLGWLEDIYRDAASYQSLTLMFQYEVALRICAKAGSKAYGRVSVLAQWLCDVRMALPVPAAAFTPPPKVDSAVVQLVPRAKPLIDAPKDALEKLVAVAFQQRRKMLKSALKPLGEEAIAAIEQSGIDPAIRPDQLSVEQYATLAKTYIHIASQ